MSHLSENRSKIPFRRIPKSVGHAVDAYEFPLRWNRCTPTKDCWTATVMTDPVTGEMLGAAVYNDDTLRGSFFQQARKCFNYVSLDLPGADEEPPELMQYATAKLAELLGPTYLVKCGDPVYYSNR